MDLEPVILERKILPKVWGGRALHELFGVPLPAGDPVGESWELYDRGDGSSRIRGSERTVRDLLESDPVGLLGGRVQPTPDGFFPLLIKFIDATARLSIQVHPGDDQARELGDLGKDEGWVVLRAGDDSRMICGLRAGVTRDAVEAAVGSGEVEALLEVFRPAIGEGVLVPAGTIHSIGPNVVLFEVQQNSDVTLRLYDWGRDRELHVQGALRALRVAEAAGRAPAVEFEQGDARGAWVLRSEHFRVRRLTVDVPASLGTEGSVKVMTVLRGMASLGWRSGGIAAPLALRPGDTVLVPACTDAVFVSPIGELEVLWTDAGEP